MTETEARALVAALDSEFSHPTDDTYVLQRRAAVESYTAQQTAGGSWRVTLLWTQGQQRFGAHIAELAEPVMVRAATPGQAALDVRMFYVEEPHAAEGLRDDDGRIWLQD